jgi:putative transposase
MVDMLYIRYPLSLRDVEDLLFERGIDLCHETVRFWWNRFGPMFAADIRRQRVSRMRGFRHWQWNLDEMYVRVNDEMHYLRWAVDHEGEVLESYVTKTRDKAAMTELGCAHKQETSRWANSRAENRHLPFRRRERAMLRFRRMTRRAAKPTRYRNLPRSTPTSIITSTRSAISSVVRSTSNAAQLHWLSGR